jgi:hypothetical protein
MVRLLRPYLALSFLPSLLVLSTTTAFAEDCQDDSECDEGYACEKSGSTPPCAAPEAGGDSACENTPVEDEVGSCVKLPETCESNQDCDEYLSCVSSATGTCTSTPDGGRDCQEPAETTKYCAPQAKTCTSNSDCPRDFECITTELGCAASDAEDGEGSGCSPTSYKECRPKLFECDKDEACPSDWRCVNNVVQNCSGSGGGTDGGTPTPIPDGSGESVDDVAWPTPDVPAPPASDDSTQDGLSEDGSKPAPVGSPEPTDGPSDPDADGSSDPGRTPTPPDEVKCTEEPAYGYCLPKSWTESSGGGYEVPVGAPVPGSDDGAEPPRDSDGSGNSGEEGPDGADGDTVGSGSPEPAPSGESDSAVKNGGCAASPNAPTRTAWSLVGLLLLAPLARRGVRRNAERRLS